MLCPRRFLQFFFVGQELSSVPSLMFFIREASVCVEIISLLLCQQEDLNVHIQQNDGVSEVLLGFKIVFL